MLSHCLPSCQSESGADSALFYMTAAFQEVYIGLCNRVEVLVNHEVGGVCKAAVESPGGGGGGQGSRAEPAVG